MQQFNNALKRFLISCTSMLGLSNCLSCQVWTLTQFSFVGLCTIWNYLWPSLSALGSCHTWIFGLWRCQSEKNGLARNKRKPKDVTATETEKRFIMIVPVRVWVLFHCLTSVDIKNALKKLVIWDGTIVTRVHPFQFCNLKYAIEKCILRLDNENIGPEIGFAA